MKQNIHLIAIGGAVMHNLAICLKKKGYEITGSDDEIFEPAKSRLKAEGLLPTTIGWDVDRVNKKTDALILGMHAQEDNPELQKAINLGIKIFSFPEYIYEQSRNKKRVVIGGSHGKTTITAMVMHVLKKCNRDFDFLVGSQLDGFDTMVKISDAPLIIIEGDEYLASTLDKRPKFHLYHPHIALLSGIAWDHINVFPTFENYKEQFSIFIDKIEKEGTLIYCSEDKLLNELCRSKNIEKIAYTLSDHKIIEEKTIINTQSGEIALNIFGKHNLQNMEGARIVCNKLGIENDTYYHAIRNFSGAAKRLEKISENKNAIVYKDFAHSPSKLKATIEAVKQQYPKRELIACMELHTFSSLNKNFLKEYEGCMDMADIPIVYFNPHTLKNKKLPELSDQDIKEGFQNKGIEIISDSKELFEKLRNLNLKMRVILMMSSGDFNGMDLKKIINDKTYIHNS